MYAMTRFLPAASVVGLGALSTMPAHAVDIAAVSAELAEGLTNVGTIGAAVLVICVAIAVFKYVRKAL